MVTIDTISKKWFRTPVRRRRIWVYGEFMFSRPPSLPLIGTFIAMVVVITAAVIVLIYAITGSWTAGAVAGGISGVVTTALYPVIFTARSAGAHDHP
jgi:hypothetical protein